jgi:hypothetical protein
MTNKRFDTGRKDPPEGDDWAAVYRALDRANMAWLIVGPIHAVVTNWKPLCIACGVALWLKSDQIIITIRDLLGAVK